MTIFLATVVRDLSASTAIVVLFIVCRFAQRCVSPPVSQLRCAASMIGPFRLPHHLQTQSVLPQTGSHVLLLVHAAEIITIWRYLGSRGFVQKHNCQEKSLCSPVDMWISVKFSFRKKFYHLTITASLLCLMVIRSCECQLLGCAFCCTNLCLSCVQLCAIFVEMEVVLKTRLPKYFWKITTAVVFIIWVDLGVSSCLRLLHQPMIGLSNSSSSLSRNTGARLTSRWDVTFANHPDGCAASCHRADLSRRIVFRTFFDFLTTVFMLTCGACLRPLARRLLWRFSSAPPSVPLSCSRFPLSAARTRHEVSRVPKIRPPALSGCLITLPCLAANDCNHKGVCA